MDKTDLEFVIRDGLRAQLSDYTTQVYADSHNISFPRAMHRLDNTNFSPVREIVVVGHQRGTHGGRYASQYADHWQKSNQD
jgi:hypothetical protein